MVVRQYPKKKINLIYFLNKKKKKKKNFIFKKKKKKKPLCMPIKCAYQAFVIQNLDV
jgi:hypothetical protein